MDAVAREPGSPLATPAASLVEAARAEIRNIEVDEAAALLGDPAYQFVDIRDPRELAREGMIPGASKAPRGMLEFWVDPASPYYRPDLDSGRRLVLYCGSAWRSALAAAALHDMGFHDVTHIEGGFTAWQEAGHPVVERPRRGA